MLNNWGKQDVMVIGWKIVKVIWNIKPPPPGQAIATVSVNMYHIITKIFFQWHKILFAPRNFGPL